MRLHYLSKKPWQEWTKVSSRNSIYLRKMSANSPPGKSDGDDPVDRPVPDVPPNPIESLGARLRDLDVDSIRRYLAQKLGFYEPPETAAPTDQVLEEVSLDGVVRWIQSERCKNIITLAGAGISTSAGIPDFRSPETGLYHNLQKYDLPEPQAIFEINFFRQNPKPFFMLAKELYPGSFKPTISHYFIRLLHEKGLLLRHYTQNIDTLERGAGIPEEKLVEAHGTFYTSHCLDCRKEYNLEYVKDIYDEDRLTCGAAAGLQHNVCLAAITFLAVLLTILYTVHYWLKRCVPKVSDAFFIYTDAAENVLYLDPIMRSPNDTGFSKFFYQPRGMHDYMEHPGMQRRHKTVCSYLMDRFQRIFRLKRTKRFSGSLRGIAEADYDGLDVIDSFGEIELGKLESALTADVAVQTGSSLEIEGIERVLVSESLDIINSDYDFEAYPELKSIASDNGKMFDDNMLANQPSEELNMLKFFRKSRSISMQMSSRDISDIAARQQPDTEDKETQSVEFYEEFVTASLLSVIDEVPEKKPGQGIVRKKLRFEGETKAVDPDEDNAQEEEAIPEKRRRSVMFGGKHLADSDSDSNEPTTSNANKEFKSYFWSKNKNKKPTKKKSQQLPLR